jgi:hypothetical protein
MQMFGACEARQSARGLTLFRLVLLLVTLPVVSLEEVAEFVEFVEQAGRSEVTERVLGHLAATTFVIACQLPTSDIDDDGYNAISHFLTFFVEHCGA